MLRGGQVGGGGGSELRPWRHGERWRGAEAWPARRVGTQKNLKFETNKSETCARKVGDNPFLLTKRYLYYLTMLLTHFRYRKVR